METKSISKQLFDAVGNLDLEKVKETLELGADPNYFEESYRTYNYHPSVTWRDQPYTPLRTVIFRSSDCCLEDEDQETLAEIATLLLDKGATPESALEYAEQRYGRFTRNHRFLAWNVIHTRHGELTLKNEYKQV